MRDYPNIEKCGFHKGQYVGYAGGTVWRITKSNSSYGTWVARDLHNHSKMIFAFRLSEMSKKLASIS